MNVQALYQLLVLLQPTTALALGGPEGYAAVAKAQKSWAAEVPGGGASMMRRAASIMEQRHEEIVS